MLCFKTTLQLCSALSTESAALDELQLLCRASNVFAREQLWSNLEWMERKIWINLQEREKGKRTRKKELYVALAAIKIRGKKQNTAPTNNLTASVFWSIFRKFWPACTFVGQQRSLIEGHSIKYKESWLATGTKGERRWRRIFVHFEGSGCGCLLVVAACLHSFSWSWSCLPRMQPLWKRPVVPCDKILSGYLQWI